MFVQYTLTDAIAQLECATQVISDVLIPATQAPLSSNCYRAEYAWQHSYERQLLRQARCWLENHRHELIGPRGLLSEALSNAYAHGNRRDPSLAISVDLFAGQNGFILRVGNSGSGFDVAEMLAKYRRNRHYFNVGGNGTRRFDECRSFRAFYDGSGRFLHLWYEDAWLPHDVSNVGTETDSRAGEPSREL